jgi:hypothetical protein
MRSNEKLRNTHREINLFYLKLIYNEAFYWYLIHMGHTMEKAELMFLLNMKN